jgi:hypothetical protein
LKFPVNWNHFQINKNEKIFLSSKVVFLEAIMVHHPSHDDYGKTIDDIEKRFFAINCQQKNLNRKNFSDYWFSGNWISIT